MGTIGCHVVHPVADPNVDQNVHSREGHIRGMAVLSEWQGSGLASKLLASAESELRALGCSCRITLDTTAPLRPAIRFYEKHGSHRSGKVTDFFGMELFEFSQDSHERNPDHPVVKRDSHYHSATILSDTVMKLADIASALGAGLENASPDTEITSVAGIEQAGPRQLTFVSNPKYNAAAKTTKASAVIVSENFPALETGMLRSKNPFLASGQSHELFCRPPRYAPEWCTPSWPSRNSARMGAFGLRHRRRRRHRRQRRPFGARSHLSRSQHRQ